MRCWQRSLVTLVGVWAIFHGVSEIFAAFTLRQAGKRPSGWSADPVQPGARPAGLLLGVSLGAHGWLRLVASTA